MVRELPLPKELESAAVVRFQDCDPYGHLNNARYIDYFMNARTDQVAEVYGFNIFEYGRLNNQAWVVSKSQIAYLAPAHLMEEVIIRTRLIHLGSHQIVIEGIMFDVERNRPKAISWVEFTFVSLATGRPASHPEDILSFFGQVLVNDGYMENGFNERVKAVKGQFRRRPVLATAGLQPVLS